MNTVFDLSDFAIEQFMREKKTPEYDICVSFKSVAKI